MTTNKPNGTEPSSLTDSSESTETTTLEADITRLTSLLSQETLDDSGEANVAELLARLESADGMARGVESRLDNILGNLDNLLATLESKEESADATINQLATDHTNGVKSETNIEQKGKQ